MSDRLVAVGDVSVHTFTGEDQPEGTAASQVRTVTLGPGESVDAAQVPDYILEAVESGEITRLKLVSEEEAERMSKAISAGVPLEDPGMNMTSESTPDGAPDEALSDAEAAHLAAQQVDDFIEIGESGPVFKSA